MILTKDSYFKFSGGEVHCKVKDFGGQGNHDHILMKDYSMDGLMALAEYCEIAYRHKTKVHVTYPYFPYARQDRVINSDEPFSLRIFCKFLNSLSLASVTVMDPHSDVASALVHDIKVIPQHEIAQKTIPYNIFKIKDLVYVSPDAGAYKKVSKLVECRIPHDGVRDIVIGTKQRNALGEIVETSIFSPVDITGKSCIIVDDICDGGRTFTELTKVLLSKGAKEVYLYVTHGIFSKGLIPLKDAGIKHVFTTDSFEQDHDNFLTVKEFHNV